jgi:hypothetical protein
MLPATRSLMGMERRLSPSACAGAVMIQGAKMSPKSHRAGNDDLPGLCRQLHRAGQGDAQFPADETVKQRADYSEKRAESHK